MNCWVEEVRNTANYTDVPATRLDAVLQHHIHHRNSFFFFIFYECSCIFTLCIHFGTGAVEFWTVCTEKKEYSCCFGLTKGKNIVTSICKNICSFSAFFHWHFPTSSVTDQSSKLVCHWASGERKQTLSSVDQKTPVHFDASLAVCLVPSRLESQTHPTLLATRAKQSQALPLHHEKPLLTFCFIGAFP